MTKSFEAFDLTGRTALITGAAGLLGVEHAGALLESGATVLLTDVDEAGLDVAQTVLSKEGDPSRIRTRVMDVAQDSMVRAVSAELSDSGQRIDILINNASIDPKVTDPEGALEASRLEHFSLEQWNMQLAVGLTGAFLCSQVFGSAMARDGKGGVILNIASDLSVFSPDQRLYRRDGLTDDRQPVKPVTYSVIKTGLIGLTRYLATYWTDRGVRANALSPGGVRPDENEEFVQRLSSLIPLGRMARPDEYRAAVQFLCSDASAYLTGQNIVMDGGRSVW
jgi:NAD(P)-dependent dehydrogenase (short-subunit alcohol dehydrogenase family)